MTDLVMLLSTPVSIAPRILLGMSTDDKVRENRLRRMADRQGLKLLKSRAQDPRGLTYGCYGLVDIWSGGSVVADDIGRGYPLSSLDEVEEYLSVAREREQR